MTLLRVCIVKIFALLMNKSVHYTLNSTSTAGKENLRL